MRYMFLRFPEGKPRAVTLSFDDGVRQDIKFSEIVTKHGLKCTFNINSGRIGEGTNLTAKEIKEHILDKGHEVAVHGEYHKASGLVSAIEGIKDVLNCRIALEKEYDTIIRGMAYADTGITVFQNGTNYQTVRDYLMDLGIAYARTFVGNGKLVLPDDWYAWAPTAHFLSPQLPKYIDEFLNYDFGGYFPRTYPRLLFICGHSYECDRENNWEKLEEICSLISQKSDVWYATNIEIYEYVTAYNSLVLSADGTKIYNPTLKEIWFAVDGAEYKIASGQTLKINS